VTAIAHRPLVLLDLDGTISEPRVGIRNGYRAAFAAVDRPIPTDAEVDGWIGPPLREAFPLMGIPVDRVEEAVDAYRSVYNETGWLENELYPYMADVVATLATDGPIALATAKPTGLATRILEHFELLDYFSFVGGASLDTSRDTKGAVIAHVLDELDTGADQAVMVGDRAADVTGASEHDIPTIGVLWGHGSEPELRDAGAVAVVHDPRDLIALVR